MSSLFTEAEIELARLGLAALRSNRGQTFSSDPYLDIVVGGLGLGYTAVAALEESRFFTLATSLRP